MSISIKLMGVPGPKLLDDEQHTQDMLGVSTPTFVTPDTRANAQLQHWSLRNAAIFYFINSARLARPRLDHAAALDEDADEPARGRVLQLRPVPARRGAGDAVLVRARRRKERTRVPRLPLPPARQLPARRDGRRRSPRRTSSSTSAAGADRPVPDADREQRACSGRRSCSPRVPAAVLRIPKQTFDSPEQLDFARVLTYNPWHCIAEHRPLGNQSRARKRMYYELARLRQQMNAVEHYEPTGDEDVPRARRRARQAATPRGPAGRSTRRP